MVTNYHGVRRVPVSNRTTHQVMNWEGGGGGVGGIDMELFHTLVLIHKSLFTHKLMKVLRHVIITISQYSGKRYKDFMQDIAKYIT